MNKIYCFSLALLAAGFQCLAMDQQPTQFEQLKVAYDGLERTEAGLGLRKLVEMVEPVVLFKASVAALQARVEASVIETSGLEAKNKETRKLYAGQALGIITDIPTQGKKLNFNFKPLEEFLQGPCQEQKKSEIAKLTAQMESEKSKLEERNGALVRTHEADKTKQAETIAKLKAEKEALIEEKIKIAGLAANIGALEKQLDNFNAEVNPSFVARYPKTALTGAALTGAALTTAVLTWWPVWPVVRTVARKR